ncbi:hypothetical protein PN462_19995 [Spirulina sp. CS-785/01]|uniref:hypothetical protein n=1 Tax=Spirulina sp. CS-785/01 TaxID=3021716 RepID=UPI00232EA0CB|nr:hypothetical protein [Spirulina sp. CS-785/01]MDB9315408.1 hypothetical protein [Spirulina sp. CS-785/01]
MTHSNESERRLAAQEFEKSLEELHELLGGDTRPQPTQKTTSNPPAPKKTQKTAWEKEKEDFEAWLEDSDED